MKKIICLSIACFLLSQVAHAQGASLESFFNHYAEKDGFTYIHHGGSKNLLENIPSDIRQELNSAKFIKNLSTNNAPADFITTLKEILLKQKFELVRMVKDDRSRIETYQKESDNKDFDNVTIIINDTNIFIRWISGTTK